MCATRLARGSGGEIVTMAVAVCIEQEATLIPIPLLLSSIYLFVYVSI